MSTKHEFLRREFLHLSGLTSIGAFLLGHKLTPVSYAASAPLPTDTSADAALQTLKEGNQRYVSMKPIHPNLSVERRTEVAKGQKPFAIIFECVDSRVPPELVFDRGLGDLFVVLGNRKWGAVAATIEVLEKKAEAHDQIRPLVELIKPAVEKVKNKPGDLLDNAIRANIALGVDKLKTTPLLTG